MASQVKVTVTVSPQDFQLQTEYDALCRDNQAGAIVSFIGLVREKEVLPQKIPLQQISDSTVDDTIPLLALEIEHYPEMTEAVILRICRQAAEKWDLLACRVIHRIGKLAVGEQIVLVLVSSKHRKNAFEANEYIMDFLKTQAPFWKKAITQENEFWIDANQADNNALEKWTSDPSMKM